MTAQHILNHNISKKAKERKIFSEWFFSNVQFASWENLFDVRNKTFRIHLYGSGLYIIELNIFIYVSRKIILLRMQIRYYFLFLYYRRRGIHSRHFFSSLNSLKCEKVTRFMEKYMRVSTFHLFFKQSNIYDGCCSVFFFAFFSSKIPQLVWSSMYKWNRKPAFIFNNFNQITIYSFQIFCRFFFSFLAISNCQWK